MPLSLPSRDQSKQSQGLPYEADNEADHTVHQVSLYLFLTTHYTHGPLHTIQSLFFIIFLLLLSSNQNHFSVNSVLNLFCQLPPFSGLKVVGKTFRAWLFTIFCSQVALEAEDLVELEAFSDFEEDGGSDEGVDVCMRVCVYNITYCSISAILGSVKVWKWRCRG